jgi:hypothetical protein
MRTRPEGIYYTSLVLLESRVVLPGKILKGPIFLPFWLHKLPTLIL